MKHLLLLSLAFLSLPVYGEQLKNPCDGITQTMMSLCAEGKLNKTRTELKTILTPEANELWNDASYKVCKQVYKLYKMGSMYPKIVADCNRQMNEYLIELDEYGVKQGKTSPIYRPKCSQKEKQRLILTNRE
jgi:hypothetical protein|tara:strand:- start:98 stop:493 length:396 start_codon:yes stop_codon:yes gene_type:complete